jgi:proline iminopeptidase
MFPPIEPFASGLLPVSNGNEIFWEASGNPHGIPALTLHGGPGSGLGAGYRRRFDPERFLIIGLDQRGCGRSRPLVIDPAAPALATNTTQAIIADIEALRAYLGVEQWLVTGLSWGSTLTIAYAQAHPERVSAIVLLAVTSTSPQEVEWITETIGAVFPEEWEQFEAASRRAPGQRVIDGYYALLTDPDPAVRAQAAYDWCVWEDVHVSLMPGATPSLRYEDPEFRQIFATLVTHYWSHSGFAGDGGLLAGMDRIAHIPAALIHGQMDVSGPLITAWNLHKAWPASELIVVKEEGHGGDEMIDLMVDAIARYAPQA